MLLTQVSFVQIYCFCTQGCVFLTFVTHVKIFMYIEKKIVLPLIALLLFFFNCMLNAYIFSFLWAHA